MNVTPKPGPPARALGESPWAALLAPSEHRHYFLRVRETERAVDDDTVVTEYAYKCLCGERVDP